MDFPIDGTVGEILTHHSRGSDPQSPIYCPVRQRQPTFLNSSSQPTDKQRTPYHTSSNHLFSVRTPWPIHSSALQPTIWLVPLYRTPSSSITFYHPGYSTIDASTQSARINDFPAGDDEDSDALIFSPPSVDNNGHHHGTALAACVVIACNCSGFLTRSAPGGNRVTLPWDSVLPTWIKYYY